MNKWKLIYNFSHPKIARAALIVLLGMFSSSITILLSLSIGNYYEILSRHHSNKSMVLSQLHIKLPHDPNTFFIVFALVVMFKMALQFGEKYFSESLALSFTSGLQRKLFRHHVRMNMTDFSKKPVGKYLLRYSGDMTSIRQYISKGIFRFTADCIFILLTLVLLFNIDATITLVIIIALLLSFLFLNFINKKLRQIQSVRRDTLSSNLHFVNEGLKAISTIKIFNREYSTIKKYKGKNDKLMYISKRYLLLNSFSSAFIPAMLFFSLLLVFIVHLQNSADSNGNLDPSGKFIPYILLVILMFPVYKRFLGVSRVWQNGNIAFSKISTLLNFPLEEGDNVSMEYQPTQGIIEFRNVSFGYPGQEPLFSNLSFGSMPGDINQLQGKYKSTIFKLLLGIYTPGAGTILLDGINANFFSKKSIRENIAFISDEAPLTGNTIYKCLYLKKSEDGDCRFKAVELLELLNFSNGVNKESIDLDAKIGENGKHLSNTQYKKLLIARALLGEKKIILIDGVLENLEADTQKSIFRILHQLKENHTIIIVGSVSHEHKCLPVLMAS